MQAQVARKLKETTNKYVQLSKVCTKADYTKVNKNLPQNLLELIVEPLCRRKKIKSVRWDKQLTYY